MEAASDRRKKTMRGLLIGGVFCLVDLLLSLFVYRLVTRADGQLWDFIEGILRMGYDDMLRVSAYPFSSNPGRVEYYTFYGLLFLVWGFACGFFGWAFSKRSAYLTLARSAGLYIALCSVVCVIGFLVASTGGR